MNTWLSTSQFTPPAPGAYWTRTDTNRRTDEHHVTHITYRADWLRWDGVQWQGGDPGYFYGEKGAGVNKLGRLSKHLRSILETRIYGKP